MITLSVIAGYVAIWVLCSSCAMRQLAQRVPACKRYSFGSHMCSHISAHWRGDGTIGPLEVRNGCLVALLWPVALLPVAAYLLATRTATPRGLQTRIAELEREAGIR